MWPPAPLTRIAKGDIPPKITESYNGDFNLIKNNLNTCIDAMVDLVATSTAWPAPRSRVGSSTRAETSGHQGDFRKIVEGVNQTLDALVAPINEASAVLENLSQRDLRARMKGDYRGDHAKIKESVNRPRRRCTKPSARWPVRWTRCRRRLARSPRPARPWPTEPRNRPARWKKPPPRSNP